MNALCALIAAAGADPHELKAAGSLVFLLGGLVALLLVVGLMLVWLSVRRHRLAGRDRARRKTGENAPDAWSEAGRRAKPDGGDDDTVDLDPWDLSPNDVDPRNGSGGTGGSG